MTKSSTPAPEGSFKHWHKLTFATLALALVLRLWLVWSGGQGFWPDEGRYQAADAAVALFEHDQPRQGWLTLIGTADHLFFKIISLPSAWADWKFGKSQRRAASYLALFSVAALALVGGCARSAGAGPRETWLAVFFATCASTLFYYSRHLLPYDAALALCLAALAVSLRPTSVLLSLLAGILAGLGFLTYNGYWMVGGVILTVHVLRSESRLSALVRAISAGIGLAIPIIVFVVAAHILGADLVSSFRQFSGTIFQGDFGRGHIFVWQYLWSAEGGMLIFWLSAAGYATARTLRDRSLGRPAIWLLAALAIYSILWVFADALRVFVVYGRTARALAPFFCLLSAWSVNDFWTRRRWTDASLLGFSSVIGILAAYNFAGPIRIVFNAEFLEEASVIVRKNPTGIFRLLHVDELRPGEQVPTESQAGEVLLRGRHPLQFRPYLFEGFNEAQRGYLASRDIAMRLERMPVSLPESKDGYPGALRLRLRLPSDRPGASEPLVTTGVNGTACIAYVHYIDANHVSFDYDSWGSGALSSGPLTVDLNVDHDVLVFFGSMLPAGKPEQEGKAAPRQHERMRDSVLVILDGRIVLAGRADTHPSPADRITVGSNLVGCSVAGISFHGAILDVRSVDTRELEGDLDGDRTRGPTRPTEWLGFPGPFHMVVDLPVDRSEQAQPLMTAGADSSADCLYVAYDDKGNARLRFSRGESTFLQSNPLAMSRDGRLDLTVSVGSLMPPENSAIFTAHPEWIALRDQIWVEANGEPVLAKKLGARLVDPGDIRILSNVVGVPMVQGYFTGKSVAMQAVDPSAVISRIPPMGLELSSPPMPLDGYPGPFHFKLQFPASPGAGAEPLVVSGTTGAGDIVYAKYDGSNGIRFGFDHWSYGGPVSDSVTVDPSQRQHELVISEGGLFPPAESPVYAMHPAWRQLREWTVVILDGALVLKEHRSAYPARPDQITTGLNLIGGSTTNVHFSGQIDETEFASPEMVLKWITNPNSPESGNADRN